MDLSLLSKIAGIGGFVLNVITIAGGIYAFKKITENELAHVNKALVDIVQEQYTTRNAIGAMKDNFINKVNDLEVAVARIETHCKTLHEHSNVC